MYICPDMQKSVLDIKQVFDPLRKKYVALTPEEVVRQQVIHYLIDKKGWPSHLMMSEAEIEIGKVKFRCDIICYDRDLKPKIIVECKAPKVKITRRVFEQIWRYALILKVPWLMVTGGALTYVLKYNSQKAVYEYVKDVPAYNEKKEDEFFRE